jgi:hypothetical protein
MLGRDSEELGGVVLTVVLLGALFAVFLGFAAGPVWALAFAAALGAVVVVWGWRLVRRSEQARPSDADVPHLAAPADGISRLLVVADPGCRSEALADQVELVAAGRPAEVFVVAPAPTSRSAHWTGGDTDARRHAQQRLDETLVFLAAAGLKARAEIGDDDPLRATDDVLRSFSAAEIVYVTRPGSTWLDGEVVALAERRYDQPVRSVVVEP